MREISRPPIRDSKPAVHSQNKKESFQMVREPDSCSTANSSVQQRHPPPPLIFFLVKTNFSRPGNAKWYVEMINSGPYNSWQCNEWQQHEYDWSQLFEDFERSHAARLSLLIETTTMQMWRQHQLHPHAFVVRDTPYSILRRTGGAPKPCLTVFHLALTQFLPFNINFFVVTTTNNINNHYNYHYYYIRY